METQLVDTDSIMESSTVLIVDDSPDDITLPLVQSCRLNQKINK
jgi:hypothetical protein